MGWTSLESCTVHSKCVGLHSVTDDGESLLQWARIWIGASFALVLFSHCSNAYCENAHIIWTRTYGNSGVVKRENFQLACAMRALKYDQRQTDTARSCVQVAHATIGQARFLVLACELFYGFHLSEQVQQASIRTSLPLATYIHDEGCT